MIIFSIALWIIYRRHQQHRLQQEVSSILFEYSPVSSVEMEAVLNSNLKETLVVVRVNKNSWIAKLETSVSGSFEKEEKILHKSTKR